MGVLPFPLLLATLLCIEVLALSEDLNGLNEQSQVPESISMRYDAEDVQVIFDTYTDLSGSSLVEDINDVMLPSLSTPLKPKIRLRKPSELPSSNSTHSFWLHTSPSSPVHPTFPLTEEGSTGPLTQKADVCVIGSGMTGTSFTWHLLEKLKEKEWTENLDVVVLEAREFCSGATGRNGGHLTRNPFLSFLSRASNWNSTSEAVKSTLIESYTADSLIQFIKSRKLESYVDLVQGGHMSVFRSAEEEEEARKDWEAARQAEGLEGTLDDVRWVGNAELKEKYGLHSSLNYTGVFFEAHNLWPCKLVTQLFLDAVNTSVSLPSEISIDLHTNTPVTSISRTSSPARVDQASLGRNDELDEWMLNTPRGTISCSYVVHATNAYASQLLPFLAGIENDVIDTPGYAPSFTLDHGVLDHTTFGFDDAQMSLTIDDQQVTLPRGIHGIIPTRGQVGAVRSSVGPEQLKWINSWDGGGGWEYWFPRYQEESDLRGEQADEKDVAKNPLIIIGGGRESSGPGHELGISDDSDLNPNTGKALREFLPAFFENQFKDPISDKKAAQNGIVNDTDDYGWELEWTGIMAFTKDGSPFVGPVKNPFRGLGLEFESIEENDTEEDYEGQYIAAGYTGHGMPRAYACAEALAGLVVSKITGEEWVKPEWLPERYLNWATRG